jgi:hypothetical protein
MSALSEALARQGLRSRFEPAAFDEPREGLADRISQTEAELGLEPEQPEPEPIAIKVEQRGRVEHENLVVTGEPS